ncbi:MAG: 50S ribosomal protein L30 [Myxococcales bacterium]
MAGIKVKLVKSAAGASADQKATLEGMGLYRFGSERILPDNASTEGMCVKLRHLVQWERVSENPPKRARTAGQSHKRKQQEKAAKAQ